MARPVGGGNIASAVSFPADPRAKADREVPELWHPAMSLACETAFTTSRIRIASSRQTVGRSDLRFPHDINSTRLQDLQQGLGSGFGQQ
jgi:hypothetical protein